MRAYWAYVGVANSLIKRVEEHSDRAACWNGSCWPTSAGRGVCARECALLLAVEKVARASLSPLRLFSRNGERVGVRGRNTSGPANRRIAIQAPGPEMNASSVASTPSMFS